MLDGLSDIKDSGKNLRKTPWSSPLDLLSSHNKGMLNIISILESLKREEDSGGVSFS